MAQKSGVAEQVISLPKGGGALHGLGEKFSPDLNTGTGNFTVPIALPPGRNGFQPQVNLVYSTAAGNGTFGLGWNISIPGITRKTSKGIPKYEDAEDSDVFILSGAEDLVPVSKPSPCRRYRPRTEGLFARVDRINDPANGNDYWEVRSKDGLVSIYGKPGMRGKSDPAAIGRDVNTKFAWKLIETRDSFGNLINYTYVPDEGQDGPHKWSQPLLSRIEYADTNNGDSTYFLISVSLEYEEQRLDSFSDYRAGFEIRTTKRSKAITVETHFDNQTRKVRKYKFTYDNNSLNHVSLLTKIDVIGHDDAGQEVQELPPLTFSYTAFDPGDAKKRTLLPILGENLPPGNLGRPEYELADLTGDGLPDVLEMSGLPDEQGNSGATRYWRNLGNAQLAMPLTMKDAPPARLADPGVQLLDANGDGRIELMMTTQPAGHYALNFDGTWDKRSFQRYQYSPTFSFEDPEVRLFDLDGDGVTDALRSGTRFECYFNDPHLGWEPTCKRVLRKKLSEFPDINFSDPRVKLGDMTGDGLQDIVLIHNGSVEYWPNLGHGNWGKQITMQHRLIFNDPGLPLGYDPRRVLIGDVDGDGVADLVYVGSGKVTLWINCNGNSWSDPIEITGTPAVTDMNAVRLVDLLGSGVSGVLWSADVNTYGQGRPFMFFLDFTGGAKPYLLHEMDNHLGATTRVGYKPSTYFYLADQQNPKTRWKTHLPFPVQVVAQVEVIDYFSGGKLTTEYRYHHGYWDGAEREFRGFGMVEQLDTEAFDRYNGIGLHGDAIPFSAMSDQQDKQFFSSPTLTRTWFHQGPVGPEFGDWQKDLDLSDTFWVGDRTLLDPWEHINRFLTTKFTGDLSQQRRIRRDALRTLRGSILRTELYVLDRYDNQDRIDPKLDRPYTVTESQYGLVEIDSPPPGQVDRNHIFFPHAVAQRTTQWERGDDPLTQITFTNYLNDTDKFDNFGRVHNQTNIACPRGWRKLADAPDKEYLATRTCTDYAERDDAFYMVDRVKCVTTYGYRQTDTIGQSVPTLVKRANGDPIFGCIGQTINYYDGKDKPAEYGKLGDYGALTLTETFSFDDDILKEAYGAQKPPYLTTESVPWSAEYPADFKNRISGLPGSAGYVWHGQTMHSHYQTGYFITTRREYDVQVKAVTHRGLVVAQYDPLGNKIEISYDHQLLPNRVTDAVGLETRAEFDYRVLQPSMVIDPNGNRTVIRYSPMGLPLSIAILGKQGNHEGDRWREGNANTGTLPIDYPSQYFEYGPLAYFQTENLPHDQRKPVYVRTLKRQDHFWDFVNIVNNERSGKGQPNLTEYEIDNLFPADELAKYPERFIEVREYSDGFGRLLQTRTQGEEERFGDQLGNGVIPSVQGDTHDRDPVAGVSNKNLTTPNMVVSGWQIYDNKGRVVEKYEPYFDTGWDYVGLALPHGVKAAMFYDPRGQVVRTLNPDGSEQRVTYGVPGSIKIPVLDNIDCNGQIVYEPTPWEAYTYDANDLALLSCAPNGTSLAGYAPPGSHYTPSSIEIDALGRTIKTVQRLSPNHEIVTCSEYDLRGNPVKMVDALGRDAFAHVYDLANQRLRLDSIDAGQRLTVFDAAGNVIETCDSKGALVLHSYDVLNRPIRFWARNNASRKVTLREKLIYGDGSDPNQSANERDTNKQLNLLGKLTLHNDEAGSLQFEHYDFKGNLLKKVRQVVADGALTSGQPFEMDWDNLLSLDSAKYGTETEFDALNRLRFDIQTLNSSAVTTRKVLRPQYNRAGALESVVLDGETYVGRIAYDAKGQRTLITYGNGVLTRYAYDLQTFRLARLRTENYTINGLQCQPCGAALQDFTYEYDLVGNITAIHDRAPNCGLSARPDQLDRVFTYDAIYRLISADGRECNTLPPSPPWDDALRCNDVTKTRYYQQFYAYDDAGNMRTLKHAAGSSGNFTRELFVQNKNNGLDYVNVGSTDYKYKYDDNGNMIQENTERHFEWDHSDHLIRFSNQATSDSLASIEAQYLYDASGQRVKKWVRNQQGQIDTIIYINGLFEHHRWQRLGEQSGENTQMHVMDNQNRVAIVRDGSRHPKDGGEKVQYHLGDQLSNSSLVIGGSNVTASGFIDREEYYPYGETSFGSFGRKRYRFTSKEKDEESGLHYHGARYYAPWLGRWASTDPAGTIDGRNLFLYALDNPIKNADPDGKQSKNYVTSSSSIWIDWTPRTEDSWQGKTEVIIDSETKLPIPEYSIDVVPVGKPFTGINFQYELYFAYDLYLRPDFEIYANDSKGEWRNVTPAVEYLGRRGTDAAPLLTQLWAAADMALTSIELLTTATTGIESILAQKNAQSIAYMERLEQHFTLQQRNYLLQPYKGMGHHYVPRNRLGVQLPEWFSESRFNVLKPNISRGEFFELHFRVDPAFKGTGFGPKRAWSWSGSKLSLEKYGQLGRLWYGSPTSLKLTIGSAATGISIGVTSALSSEK